MSCLDSVGSLVRGLGRFRKRQTHPNVCCRFMPPEASWEPATCRDPWCHDVGGLGVFYRVSCPSGVLPEPSVLGGSSCSFSAAPGVSCSAEWGPLVHLPPSVSRSAVLSELAWRRWHADGVMVVLVMASI
eukprot:9282181-Pyramimonas_sp.AAC.1